MTVYEAYGINVVATYAVILQRKTQSAKSVA